MGRDDRRCPHVVPSRARAAVLCEYYPSFTFISSEYRTQSVLEAQSRRRFGVFCSVRNFLNDDHSRSLSAVLRNSPGKVQTMTTTTTCSIRYPENAVPNVNVLWTSGRPRILPNKKAPRSLPPLLPLAILLIMVRQPSPLQNDNMATVSPGSTLVYEHHPMSPSRPSQFSQAEYQALSQKTVSGTRGSLLR